jgi:hypothetical protein
MKNKKARIFLAFLMIFAILMLLKPLSKYFNQVYIMIVQAVLIFVVFTTILPKKNKLACKNFV